MIKNRVIPIALAILLLLGAFSPTLYAFMWHLRHGNRITFRGAEVQVPFGWVAEPGEVRTLDFTKFPFHIFGLKDTTSGFALGKVPDAGSRDPEEIYKSWVTVNWTLWNRNEGVITGPLIFGTGKKEVVCMSSFPKTASGYGTASCLLFHRTWMATFIGNGIDVDTFFGIVRGASSLEESSSGKP